MLWGVMLYVNKKRTTLVSTDPTVCIDMPILNVCTARSAKLFDFGDKHGAVGWRMSFILQKFSNWCDIKHWALSVTKTFGIPQVQNDSLNLSMVTSESDDLVAYIHLFRVSINHG